jgi:ferredoxin
MTNRTEQDLTDYLVKFDESDWLAAVDELLPCIHEVDRDAVRIWFRFYPVELRLFLDAAEDREAAIQGLALQGEFELSHQIDTSHHFLYGHRFWPTVKAKIEKMMSEPPAVAGGLTKGTCTQEKLQQTSADSSSELQPPPTAGGSDSADRSCGLQPPATAGGSDSAELVEIVKAVACQAARKLNVERSLVNAIAAVGLMTLKQVGANAFTAASGETAKPVGLMAKSPDAIVAARAKDDSQGLLGFLRTVDKQFSIKFAGTAFQGKFPVMNDQHITHAAAKDRSRDWQSMDKRCWEGPVPVECTAASCGTCWIGVIGGKEKLSEVNRRERRAMKVFGYNQPDEEKPFLRLACQTKAYGNATIVIPPWNGVFGKKVYGNVEEVELAPVTTSAQALREIVSGKK